MSTKESAGQERAEDLPVRQRDSLSAEDPAENGKTQARTSDSGSLQEEAAQYSAETSSPFSTTEEALARLDAASEKAKERRLAAASLRKMWPIVFGAAGMVILLAAWAGLTWIKEAPQGLSSAVSAAITNDTGQTPFVLVSFNDRATIADITKMLQGLGLEITSGPLPGGVYRVNIPAENGTGYDAITASLDQDPSVGWLVVGRRPSDR